ncbi:MAG TPA: hypothetical protein VFZ53_25645 [Polyangiaceae bacterium]
MRTRSRLSWFVVLAAAGACNAVFGMEELEEGPPGGSSASSGQAGEGSGGTAGSGRGGSSGSGRGGTSGSSGSAGTSGEAGGGMGGGGGDCEPTDETTCGAVFPELLGNCREGQIVCGADGTWGECSVTPQTSDSCETEGDDADCDGTANEGCPCLDGATRDCGPDTDDGICEFGTQTCADGMWGDCEDAVLPEARDCLSAADNDCDGVADNERDDECPCAVDGEHVCVDDAPTDWEGPMAIATAAATASSPSCTGTGYERQVLTMFGAVDMGSAMCGCACSPPGSMSCGPVNIQAGTSSCIQLQTVVGPAEYSLNAGTCQNVNGGGWNFYPTSAFSSSGSCTPQPSSNFTRARFTRRVTGCETNTGSAAGCAAASQCVPTLDNPLEKFCIYRAGAVACPSGPYTERTVYSDTVDDPRSCSACTCGSATGQCTGSVNFVRSPCPGMVLSNAVALGSCENVYDGGLALAASAGTPMPVGSCPPSASNVQGSVTTTGDTTVCCKP